MPDLISVIIPIYKVEKYLDECIISVINQTYKNLEIILVDDGSPDNCPKICDDYAKKDSRIKVIHKENGGASDARNKGIDVAIGKYIMFIDPDDYVSEDIVEVLYNNLINNNADISICGFINFSNNVKIKKVNNNIYKLNSEEAIKSLLKPDSIINFVVVWCKLYKAELFDDIKFPYGKLREDEFITYRLYARSENIIYTEKQMYFYRQREDSMMRKSKSVKQMNDLFEALYTRFKFLNVHFPNLAPKAFSEYINKHIKWYEYIKYSSDIEPKKENLLKIREHLKKEYLNYKNIFYKTEKSFRFKFFMFMHVYPLYEVLRMLKQLYKKL